MQPKILMIQTFYTEFLKDIYSTEPGLADCEFETQHRRLFDSAFSTSDAYSYELKRRGCDANEVICNADAAQAAWAESRGLSLSDNIHDRRRQIVAAQVDEFRPDVVYVFEWSPLGDDFLAALKKKVRLVVGEVASPLHEGRTYRGYDLMISSWPPFVDHFRRNGLNSDYVRLGFDRRILDRLAATAPCHNVTFVGGFAPSHPDRAEWLEALLAEIDDIDIFCYGLETTRPDSPIRRRFRGQAWGMEMYRTLHQSRITLNRHARLAVDGVVNTDHCNNMRMYEATGVGTLLVTEWRPRLHDLFEPDREVVTYRNDRECVEKIRHYLGHEADRTAVARAGHRRTLREHLYSHRMNELLCIFRRYLNRGRSARPSPSMVSTVPT